MGLYDFEQMEERKKGAKEVKRNADTPKHPQITWSINTVWTERKVWIHFA